jgi:membrane protein
MEKLLKKYVYRSQLVISLLRWSKSYAFPGFNNVPVYDIISFLIKELKADNLTTRANSVAFNFFLSLFPLVIFVLPLVARLPLTDDFLVDLQNSLQGVVPDNARQYLVIMITEIRDESQVGLQSIGFILSIFFASSGMLTLMYGFDKSYELSFKSRNYFHKRWIALLLTSLVSILFILSVVFIILGEQIVGTLLDRSNMTTYQSATIFIIRWLILVISFYSVISLIYRYGSSLVNPLRLINPGAILATSISLFSSIMFSYFVNNFGRYNEIYGSIGALIVILIWLQINAFILLAGFELNASIAVNRDLIKSREDD